MNRWRSERGAAAVEFALVLPVLLALVLGCIEFGRAYNTQISLTHAAREAARSMVVTTNWTQAVTNGKSAASTLNAADMQFTATPAACSANSMVEIKVTYPLQTLTGVMPNKTLTGKAAMRCGG